MATSLPSALPTSHDMTTAKLKSSGSVDPDQLADDDGDLHASSPDTPGTVDAEADSDVDGDEDEVEEDAKPSPDDALAVSTLLPPPPHNTSLSNTKRRAESPPVRYSGITSFAPPTLPDATEEHHDINMTDPKVVVRLLSLLQNGWTLSRGLGHRESDCLWCRGPLDSKSQILTHRKCKNSWAASCIVSPY
jgi:hypothetical protein